MFGSLFSSLPSCASLSRSLIQESAGGKTQVTSFVSCAILVVVLLFVGPVFEPLPNCVLASIIVVALKGMFLQVYDFLKMWKQSKGDALLWVASFLTTVLVDIDYGLGTGVLLSLLLLLKRNNQPTVTRLGWVPKTDIYVDIDTYQSAVSVPGACLCRVSGSLHFANVDHFRKQLMHATRLDTTQIIAVKAKRAAKEASKSLSAALHSLPTDESVTTRPPKTTEKSVDSTARGSAKRSYNLTSQMIRETLATQVRKCSSGRYFCEDGQQTAVDRSKTAQGYENKAYLSDNVHVTHSVPKARQLSLLPRVTQPSKGLLAPAQEVSYVVLCLSGVGWMDVSAAKQMGSLFMEHDNAGISMALAGANDGVMQILRQCGVLDTIPEHKLYHSLHDAVTSLLPDVMRSMTQPSPVVGDMDVIKRPPTPPRMPRLL